MGINSLLCPFSLCLNYLFMGDVLWFCVENCYGDQVIVSRVCCVAYPIAPRVGEDCGRVSSCNQEFVKKPAWMHSGKGGGDAFSSPMGKG